MVERYLVADRDCYKQKYKMYPLLLTFTLLLKDRFFLHILLYIHCNFIFFDTFRSYDSWRTFKVKYLLYSYNDCSEAKFLLNLEEFIFLSIEFGEFLTL